jgi:hypothetical protein
MEKLDFETPVSRERDIACTVHKLTYADGRAYGYIISDDKRQLRYVGKRTGLHLPAQTRLVEFFDVENNLVGRLQPPDIAPWLRVKDYNVFVGEETEEPCAVIHEQWRLVDILLLRLPRYEVRMGEHHYVAQGSRYGTNVYRILLPDEEEEEEETEKEAQEETIESIFEPPEAPEVETEAEAEDWGEFDAGKLELPEDEEVDEKLRAEEIEVGRIEQPAAGPSYIVETEAEPLREMPLVMAALVVLIDMEQHG